MTARVSSNSRIFLGPPPRLRDSEKAEVLDPAAADPIPGDTNGVVDALVRRVPAPRASSTPRAARIHAT
ncbi:hypothetical protein ACWGDT_14285 [Streptomyces avermitilis]